MKSHISICFIFFTFFFSFVLQVRHIEAQAQDSSAFLTPEQQAARGRLKTVQMNRLKKIAKMMSCCTDVKKVEKSWNSFTKSLKGFEEKEIRALFQGILMQVSMDMNSNLQAFSMRVANYRNLKQQIRDEIKLVRDAVNKMDVDEEPANVRSKKFSLSKNNDFVIKEGKDLTKREELNGYVKKLQDRLREVDEEEKQAKAEMQKKVEEQQAAMDAYSNLLNAQGNQKAGNVRGVR